MFNTERLLHNFMEDLYPSRMTAERSKNERASGQSKE